MTQPARLNNSGLPLYHLARIGPAATLPASADVMDLFRVTTVIGRNPQQVDYILDSANRQRSAYISRLHARIIRESDGHKLWDDSLNGVFVNHIKIAGCTILHEGDLVIFGHPNGMNLPAGTFKRQSNSEYQFLFGTCDCPRLAVQKDAAKRRTCDTERSADRKNLAKCGTPLIETVHTTVPSASVDLCEKHQQLDVSDANANNNLGSSPSVRNSGSGSGTVSRTDLSDHDTNSGHSCSRKLNHLEAKESPKRGTNKRRATPETGSSASMLKLCSCREDLLKNTDSDVSIGGTGCGVAGEASVRDDAVRGDAVSDAAVNGGENLSEIIVVSSESDCEERGEASIGVGITTPEDNVNYIQCVSDTDKAVKTESEEDIEDPPACKKIKFNSVQNQPPSPVFTKIVTKRKASVEAECPRKTKGKRPKLTWTFAEPIEVASANYELCVSSQEFSQDEDLSVCRSRRVAAVNHVAVHHPQNLSENCQQKHDTVPEEIKTFPYPVISGSSPLKSFPPEELSHEQDCVRETKAVVLSDVAAPSMKVVNGATVKSTVKYDGGQGSKVDQCRMELQEDGVCTPTLVSIATEASVQTSADVPTETSLGQPQCDVSHPQCDVNSEDSESSVETSADVPTEASLGQPQCDVSHPQCDANSEDSELSVPISADVPTKVLTSADVPTEASIPTSADVPTEASLGQPQCDVSHPQCDVSHPQCDASQSNSEDSESILELHSPQIHLFSEASVPTSVCVIEAGILTSVCVSTETSIPTSVGVTKASIPTSADVPTEASVQTSADVPTEASLGQPQCDVSHPQCDASQSNSEDSESILQLHSPQIHLFTPASHISSESVECVSNESVECVSQEESVSADGELRLEISQSETSQLYIADSHSSASSDSHTSPVISVQDMGSTSPVISVQDMGSTSPVISVQDMGSTSPVISVQDMGSSGEDSAECSIMTAESALDTGVSALDTGVSAMDIGVSAMDTGVGEPASLVLSQSCEEDNISATPDKFTFLDGDCTGEESGDSVADSCDFNLSGVVPLDTSDVSEAQQSPTLEGSSPIEDDGNIEVGLKTSPKRRETLVELHSSGETSNGPLMQCPSSHVKNSADPELQKQCIPRIPQEKTMTSGDQIDSKDCNVDLNVAHPQNTCSQSRPENKETTLPNMNMLEYVDSFPESEGTLNIIDLEDDSFPLTSVDAEDFDLVVESQPGESRNVSEFSIPLEIKKKLPSALLAKNQDSCTSVSHPQSAESETEDQNSPRSTVSANAMIESGGNTQGNHLKYCENTCDSEIHSGNNTCSNDVLISKDPDFGNPSEVNANKNNCEFMPVIVNTWSLQEKGGNKQASNNQASESVNKHKSIMCNAVAEFFRIRSLMFEMCNEFSVGAYSNCTRDNIKIEKRLVSSPSMDTSMSLSKQTSADMLKQVKIEEIELVYLETADDFNVEYDEIPTVGHQQVPSSRNTISHEMPRIKKELSADTAATDTNSIVVNNCKGFDSCSDKDCSEEQIESNANGRDSEMESEEQCCAKSSVTESSDGRVDLAGLSSDDFEVYTEEDTPGFVPGHSRYSGPSTSQEFSDGPCVLPARVSIKQEAEDSVLDAVSSLQGESSISQSIPQDSPLSDVQSKTEIDSVSSFIEDHTESNSVAQGSSESSSLTNDPVSASSNTRSLAGNPSTDSDSSPENSPISETDNDFAGILNGCRSRSARDLSPLDVNVFSLGTDDDSDEIARGHNVSGFPRVKTEDLSQSDNFENNDNDNVDENGNRGKMSIRKKRQK